MKFLLLPLALLLLLLSCRNAGAADVTLAWDASAEADYYTLYFGNESGSYSAWLNAGNVTQYTVTGLDDELDWYFAATASNEQGESGYSNEAMWLAQAEELQPATDVQVTYEELEEPPVSFAFGAVGSVGEGSGSTSGQSSLTGVSIGDLILAIVCTESASGAQSHSASSDQDGAFTQVQKVRGEYSGEAAEISLHWLKAATAGTHVITGSWTNSDYFLVCAFRYTVTSLAASPVEESNTNVNTNSASFSTANLDPAGAALLILVGTKTYDVGGASVTPAANWNERLDDSDNENDMPGFLHDRIVTSGGSYAVSAAASATNYANVAISAAFIEAAGGETVQFSSSAAIATSTPAAGLNVQRQLASSASTQSSTTAAILEVLRQFSSAASIQSLTQDIDLIIQRALASSAAVQSSTTAADLAVLRQLASAAAIQSLTADIDLDLGAIQFSSTAEISTLTVDIDLAVRRTLASLAAMETATSNITAAIQRALASSSSIQSATSAAMLAIRRELASAVTAATLTSDADMLVQRTLATLAAVQTLTSDINLDLGTGVKEFASTAAVQTATAAILLAVQRPLASLAGCETLSQDALLAIRRTLASSALAQTLTSDIDLTTAIQFASLASIVTSTSDVGVAVRRLIASLAAMQTDAGNVLIAILRQLVSQADAATTTAAIELLLGVLGEIINPSSVSVTPVRSLTGINIKTSTSKTPVRTIDPA